MPSPEKQNPLNPREQARINAGYRTLKEVAKRLHLGEKYLRRIELGDCVPYETACRLSRFYGCSMNIWL